MAHLATLLRSGIATHPAMRVHPAFAVAGGLEVHRLRMTEVAAIGNIHLIVASHAQRHRRKIRFTRDLGRIDPLVTSEARNRSDMFIVRKMRQHSFARLLNRGRRIVALDTDLRLREIIVFHTRALRHRRMTRGALELQCQMRAMRKISARSGGRQRYQRQPL